MSKVAVKVTIWRFTLFAMTVKWASREDYLFRERSRGFLSIESDVLRQRIKLLEERIKLLEDRVASAEAGRQQQPYRFPPWSIAGEAWIGGFNHAIHLHANESDGFREAAAVMQRGFVG